MRYISKAGLVPIRVSWLDIVCVCVCVCARARAHAWEYGSRGWTQLCGRTLNRVLPHAPGTAPSPDCHLHCWNLVGADRLSLTLHFSPAVLHCCSCSLLHWALAGWRQLNPTVSLLCQFSPGDGTHQTKAACSRCHSRPPGGNNTISMLPAVLGRHRSTLWQSIPWPHGQGSCKGEAMTSVPYNNNRPT